MLEVLCEVDPAYVRRQLAIAGHLVEFGARAVQGWQAGIATTREVKHRKIKWQAQQVIANSLRYELVDLVSHLPGQPAHDRACRLLRSRAAVRERERIEEGRYQSDVA